MRLIIDHVSLIIDYYYFIFAHCCILKLILSLSFLSF